MKQTSNQALLRIILFSATIACANTFGNPFNNSTITNLSTNIDFGEPLYVGIQNPDNAVNLISNANVSATSIIVGQLSSSSNNFLSISNGSTLQIGTTGTNTPFTGGLVVGNTEGNADVSINNTSTVDAEYLYLGYGTNESGSITVSGDDSLLNITEDAFVGVEGSTNKITINDGASMVIGNQLNIGSMASSNNTVQINSGGSLMVQSTNAINVATSSDDNSILINGGGTLKVGSDVDIAQIDDLGVELKSNANLELGGTLKLEANKIDSRLNIILNNALSTNTASWTSSSLVAIGATTSDNTLTFTNGATGTALNLVQIGQNTTAARNKINVGGSNSMFTANSDVFIGAQGKNNELNVGDWGTADVAGNLYLGNNAGATGNQLNIQSNGFLSVSGDLIVGDSGDNNTFNSTYGTSTIDQNLILGKNSKNNRYNQTGGTNTVAGTFIIGQSKAATGKTGAVNGTSDPATTGNRAIVGKDAVLNVLDLTVGQKGGGSIMTIRDGGVVNVSGDTVIGEAVGDNYIYLQRDAETRFNVTGDLIVGKEGGSNRFANYGGIASIGGSLFLGSTTNQHDAKNFIYLETTNAALHVANSLYIGASNSVNTLDIVDGATVAAEDVLVGNYDGVTDNVITITGGGSLLYVTNTLAIGSTTGSNNTVIVENGGTLYAEQNNILLGSGTANILTIADEGILKTLGWDFSAQTNASTNIVFEAGSTLYLSGILSGTNIIDGGLNVVLDGTNSSWTTTNSMFVGMDVNASSLTITNGAIATSASNLYIGVESEDNWISVAGSGSLLDIGNDLFIGSESNSSRFNTLEVLDGATVSVGNDAYLYRGATLKIDSKSQVSVSGDYHQDEFSTLAVGVSSNQTQPNLTVAGNAGFTKSADIGEYSLLKVIDDGVSESNIINVVQAKSITVDGQTASTGLIRENIQTNLLLNFSVTVSNGIDYAYIVLDDFVKRSIGEAADLQGQLLDVADEINALKIAGDSNAVEMVKIISDLTASEANTAINNFYGEKQSSVPANNVINMGLQSVARQLTQRADNTRSRMGVASARHTNPTGAAGPHMADQELQGWISGYGTKGSQDAGNGFSGYDADFNGFMVGADLSVAENMLVGIAGGAGNGSIDKDNGSTTDTRSTFLSVYGSAGTKDWFADASLIFGSSSIDSRLGSTFDTTADYDAQNVAVYFGGGKEIIGKYLIMTPEASLLGNFYEQDAYQEKSTTAVGRNVDGFDAFYLQSSVGGSLAFYTAMGNIVLKPEIRAHWLHEWNASDEDLNYSLIGGTGQYKMTLQAPEEDIIKLGIGSSAKLGDYLELRADLDARVGADYSDYTLLGSLRYQF